MHDQREKAQRDYDWMLSTVRKQGIEEGREEGTILGAIQKRKGVEKRKGDAANSVRHGGCSESWRLFLVRIATVPVGASTVSSQRLVTTAQREARQTGRQNAPRFRRLVFSAFRCEP